MISLNQHKEAITKRIVKTFTDDAPVLSGLSGFFPTETTIEAEIGIEVERNRQLIAADIVRGTDGNLNKFSQYAEKLYVPPMYAEKWNFASMDRFHVTFGQQTNPSQSDAVNMINKATRNVNKLRNKIERAVELQRAQALQTGIVQLKNGDNVDYKRKAASIVNISAGTPWSTVATATPLQDIETGCEFLRQEGLSTGMTVNAIMGAAAFNAFMATDETTKQANWRRISRLELGMPQFDGATGMVFHGQFATGDFVINIWTYNQFYETDAGVKTKYIDDKNVILIAEDFEGFSGFAGVPAIQRDVNNAEFPEYITMAEADYFINNWLDKNVKAHWFEVSSAPLVVPVSIDRVYTMQVLA